MPILRRLVRPVSGALAAALLTVNLYLPAAHAALVATDAVLPPVQVAQDRAPDAHERDVVKARLIALGVDPAQVQARVGALTDEETRLIAKHLDALPAGGDPITLLLIIILLIGIFH